MGTTRDDNPTTAQRWCGCCGQVRKNLAELSGTPGVFICRRCALWAARRAGQLDQPAPPSVASGASERSTIDRQVLHNELDQARIAFHRLVSGAANADLRRRSIGTRWTNKQLLFHMVFGYLLVRRLLPLVRTFDRLPDGASRLFAAALNLATRPFHVINYLGSYGGGRVLTTAHMAVVLDRTVRSLHHSLDSAHDADLRRMMHFPTSWDPYFSDTLTLAEVYHFARLHFEHHRAQLSIRPQD